jgi:hypothetical protein
LPQLRADSSQQHDESERLADIIVGAGIEARHGVGIGIVRNRREGIERESQASVQISALEQRLREGTNHLHRKNCNSLLSVSVKISEILVAIRYARRE